MYKSRKNGVKPSLRHVRLKLKVMADSAAIIYVAFLKAEFYF